MLGADECNFPDPETSDEQGLLAMGGNLSPARLLEAYKHGIFPWYEDGYPVLWWSPNPRLILNPKQFKCSKSLKQTLNKPFQYTIDTAFHEVIQACASTSGRVNHTWITHEMISAYCTLHQLGYAHSFEVWQDNQLAGGLYGISMGHAFFGESMFHNVRDASKLALYFLCQTLLAWDFDFIDCQLPTRHLQSLGAETISRKAFLIKLEQTLQQPTCKGKWQ